MPFTNRTFVKMWYEPAALPLYAAIAGVFTFAGWTIYREAASNEVVFRHKANPFPWQNVDPNDVPPAKRRINDQMIANVKASGRNKPVGEEPLTGHSTSVPKHW